MAHNPVHISSSSALQALELMSMPVVLVDPAYRVLHGNNAFKGLSAEVEQVFPLTELTDMFPGFIAGLFSAGDVAQAQTVVIRGLQMLGSDRNFDLYMSQNAPDVTVLSGYTVTCIEVKASQPGVLQAQELSEHHKQFLALTTTGVVIHRNNIIIYSNRTMCSMLGIGDDDTIVGLNIWEFVPEDYRTIVADRIRSIVAHKTPSRPMEERFIRRDGSYFDVEVFAFPVIFEGLPAVKTFITDITARKEAERKLMASRQQYFTLVENLTDIVFQTDIHGQFVFLNNAWEEISGYTVSETIGQSCFNFLRHPQDTALFSQKVRKVIGHGIKDFQYDLLLMIKDGVPRYVEVSVKPLKDQMGVITGISGVMRDVHAKKMADLEVRRIQKTLKEHQRILTELTREESIITGDFSKALAHIAWVTANALGASRVNIWRFTSAYQTLEGQVSYDRITDVYDDVHVFHLHQFPRYFNTLLQQRLIISDDVINDERLEEFYDIYLKPEHIISMLDIAISSGDDLWGVICIEFRHTYHKWSLEDQSFARSIADFIALAYKSAMLQSTQSALLDKENQYRNLVEQARDAVIMIDPQDRFIEVNAAACAFTGYTREELLQKSVIDLIPERYRKFYLKPSNKAREIKYFFGERMYIRKDGAERIAEISAHVYPDGRMQGIVRDITDRKLQERALKESETRLDLALKGADMGTWDFYIQENRMVHNKRWAEMLGYYFEHTVVTEQFWEKFIHPDDKVAAYRSFEQHIKGDKPFYEAEIRMLASTGEWKWILDKGKIVEWDKQGRPLRASGIHQDITHIKSYQQQLMHQKAFLQDLVDAIPNMIYVKNASNEFITVNSAFTALLNTNSDTILQQTGVLPAHCMDIITSLTARDHEVLYTRKPVIMEAMECLHGSTGKKIWLQTIKVPLADTDGNLTHVLSVSADVTELKLKESEITRLNDKLEIKVPLADADGNLTYVLSVSADVTELKLKESEITRLNDKLEIKVAERTNALELANKELETFNYSVSHDLRTPLRSIDIFAYFLEKHYSAILDQNGIENIRQIRGSVVKMSNLIDNLLIFSRMGRSDKRSMSVSIADLVEEVLSDVRTQTDLSSFDIRIRALPVVQGDQAMLRQALANLIGNAIKYSATKRHPVIEIYSYPDPGWHTVAIRDNGVGFSNELRDKLFKAFKRLHSEEKFEGSGVGLAIVERIIKRHNGRVWAESTEGRGSTFYFSLPVTQ